MTTYTVLDPLDHDGQRLGVGEEVELSPEAALPLIALRVVALVPLAPVKKSTKQSASEP